jgi:hypothetical protein
MKINIVNEQFVLYSEEVQTIFKKLTIDSSVLSSEDIEDILKKIKRRKVKSKPVKNDIKTLAGMKSYMEFLEAEVRREDEKYKAICTAIDLLVEARVAGAAVVLSKWAEEQGYDMKGVEYGW